MLGMLAGVGVFITALLLLRMLPEVGVTVRPFRPDPVGELATVIKLDESLEGGRAVGRVQYGPESWRAVFEQKRPEVGETVQIVERRNLTLICAPASSGRVPIAEADPRTTPLPRLVAGFGQGAAGLLFVFLAAPTYLAILNAPAALGVGLFGLFAPFMAVLGLMFLRSSDQSGLPVRAVRGVIAATCGFAVYAAVSVSLPISLMPLVAAIILAVLDPVLSEALAAITMGFGVGDG
jgi:hypothetical protein